MGAETERGYTLCEMAEAPNEPAKPAADPAPAAAAGPAAGRPPVRRRRQWLISPEGFRDLRHSCLLSNRQAAAAYLGVCVRTIRHWDAGRCRVPWSAVRLLRLRRAGELGGLLDGWEGWTIWRDRLVSPDGRVFLERDMRRLWLTLTQAAIFRDDYAKANPPHPVEAVHISTGRPRRPLAEEDGRWICGQAGQPPSPAGAALRASDAGADQQTSEGAGSVAHGSEATGREGGGALGFITIATKDRTKGETAEECGVQRGGLTPERHQNDVTLAGVQP